MNKDVFSKYEDVKWFPSEICGTFDILNFLGISTQPNKNEKIYTCKQ